MSNWLKNRSHLLIIIVINLLALALLTGLWWWRLGLVEKIKAVNAELATLHGQERQLAALRNLAESTAADRQALNEHFITQDTLPGFIEQVEKLKDKHRIELSLTSVTVVDKPSEHLNFRLELKGSREQLLELVGEIMRLPYRLELVAASFQAEGEGANTPVWGANLNVNLLSYEAKADPTP